MITKEKILLEIARIKFLLLVCFKNEKKEYTQVEKNEQMKGGGEEEQQHEKEDEPQKFCIE